MEIKLLRLNASLESVGLMQIACEPSIDPQLGFRMWGAKDSVGEVSRFLAKNKPALVFSLQLSQLVGNGSRPAKINSQGNLIVESLGASDVPNHNDLNGLQGGSTQERYHVTLLEKNNLHAPIVLSETNGKPLALSGQELSFLFGSSLKIVNNALEVNTSNIQHSSLAGLENDDHTQYILANGLRAFSAPVSGIAPTQGSHLVTKDYVELAIAGFSDFQESVLDIISGTPPTPPAVGARYINLVSVGAWASFAPNSILEWDGTTWFQAWNPTSSKALGARTYVEAMQQDYRYTGSGWHSIPSVTRHGALNGLSDDDHTQYPREDGSRGFSQPVSGVAPTQDSHLTTKGYTELSYLKKEWIEGINRHQVNVAPGQAESLIECANAIRPYIFNGAMPNFARSMVGCNGHDCITMAQENSVYLDLATGTKGITFVADDAGAHVSVDSSELTPEQILYQGSSTLQRGYVSDRLLNSVPTGSPARLSTSSSIAQNLSNMESRIDLHSFAFWKSYEDSFSDTGSPTDILYSPSGFTIPTWETPRTIPANYLTVGKTIRIKCTFVLASGGNNQTFKITLQPFNFIIFNRTFADTAYASMCSAEILITVKNATTAYIQSVVNPTFYYAAVATSFPQIQYGNATIDLTHANTISLVCSSTYFQSRNISSTMEIL